LKPFWEFEFSGKISGLKAFTTLKPYNLGLNTEAAPLEVISARRGLFSQAGLALENAVFMRQVHGERIAQVGNVERGRGSLDLEEAIPECDAMITRDRGIFLCVGHADCLAILIADRRQGFLGVAHAGWRGMGAKLPGKLARKMIREYGSKPSELQVGLSVCLGPCHLELSEEQYQIFSMHPEYESFCSPLSKGHFMLNLWKAAESQLLAQGLSPSQVETQGECSFDFPEKYFSYRRDRGRCGRMLSVIGFD
jgi:YfiH family protein